MIYKKTFGHPEKFVPSTIKNESKIKVLKDDTKFNNIEFRTTKRGLELTISFDGKQDIFGFGLQMKGFNHNYGKVKVRNDADPIGNSGNAHASMPLFFTAKGKGYIIDSFRDVTFYIGKEKKQKRIFEEKDSVATTTEELYFNNNSTSHEIMVEVPFVKGVSVYFIDSKSLTEAVKEYNMLSGGGCLPPAWGLGIYYRCSAKFNDRQVLQTVDYFKKKEIPLSVVGLEPGWQTHSYSCSFVWNKKRFPNPKAFLDKIKEKGYRINLWEHAFVSSAAPFYKEIFDYCGNYEVWKGLVPDFTIKKCKDIFVKHHEKLIEEGVTGFKLDECDGSDNTGGWFFPDNAEFSSGIDGEQMHNAFGVLYQKSIMDAFKESTFSQVRSTHLFSSSLPFVLYSDLYNIQDYVTACVNSGFSGVLWSPELRDCKDKKDLLNRMQLLVFSAQYVINAWYLEQEPWLEFDAEKEAKEILELRSALIPYLYSAYYNYNKTGLPPIRAIVVDYPHDAETYLLQDEFMFGESILVAPTFDGSHKRKIYLPEGKWYDFYTRKEVKSGYFDYEGDKLPAFVKENSVIPFAKPLSTINNESVFEITPVCYGSKGQFTLVGFNGDTFELKVENSIIQEKICNIKNYVIKD